MDPTVFSIQLESANRTYSAGQYITGKVIFNHDVEVPTKGIVLRFSGTAALSWTESVEQESGDALQNVLKRHANKEIYMDEELYAFGRVGASEDLVIPAGYNEFPFTYQLPPNAPSTFHFDNGQVVAYVSYRVEAKIRRSAAWKSDHKTETEFIVKAVMNVKRYSQTAQPVVVFKEKHLCCFCCKDGPVTMNVKMSKTGYMPGDPMSFVVDIINSSSKRVSNIETHLEQETKFISSSNNDKYETTKSFSEIILRGNPGPGVDSNQASSWQGALLTPQVLPTNLGGCHIIMRSYNLKVHANMPLSRPLKAVIPVIIGAATMRKEDNVDFDDNVTVDVDVGKRINPNFNDAYLPPDYRDVVKQGGN